MYGPPRALLVEDDPNLRELLGRILRERDLEVVTADRLDRAYELAGQVSLLVLDLGLVGWDGVELISMLREAKIRVPTIVVTGRHDDDLQKEVRAAGMTWWLQKPFENKSFEMAVEQAMRPRRVLEGAAHRLAAFLARHP